jgi:hypothetical protein
MDKLHKLDRTVTTSHLGLLTNSTTRANKINYQCLSVRMIIPPNKIISIKVKKEMPKISLIRVKMLILLREILTRLHLRFL